MSKTALDFGSVAKAVIVERLDNAKMFVERIHLDFDRFDSYPEIREDVMNIIRRINSLVRRIDV